MLFANLTCCHGFFFIRIHGFDMACHGHGGQPMSFVSLHPALSDAHVINFGDMGIVTNPVPY